MKILWESEPDEVTTEELNEPYGALAIVHGAQTIGDENSTLSDWFECLLEIAIAAQESKSYTAELYTEPDPLIAKVSESTLSLRYRSETIEDVPITDFCDALAESGTLLMDTVKRQSPRSDLRNFAAFAKWVATRAS